MAIKMSKDPRYAFKPTPVGDIPEKLNWGHTDNFGKVPHAINFLTTVKNQHLPVYCGSCWAQATTSTMSDRINIQIQNGTGIETSISPQMLVSCSLNKEKRLMGCNGGDTVNAAQWIADNYILDDSCMPYTATNGQCSDPNRICFDQAGSNIRQANFDHLKKWSLKDIQTITEFFVQPDTKLTPEQQQKIIDKNTTNMLNALQSGPIVCGVAVHSDMKHWKGDKIYTNPTPEYYDHDISVVGYDKTGDVPYWIVRNSWGEPWGYGGFWNVEMGKGILGIELICRTFTPYVKTDPNQVENEVLKKAWIQNSKKHQQWKKLEKQRLLAKKKEEKRLNMFELYLKHLRRASFLSRHSKVYKGCTKASWEDESVADLLKEKKKHPYKMISKYEDLPQNFSYDDYKGQNVLTWVVNQHLPFYCGSCYAQSAVSTLAERINKLHVDNDKFDPTSRTTLSTQQVLNCGIGTCFSGGSSLAVFEFFQRKYAVPWGCAVYKATSPSNPDCTDMQVCSTCWPNTGCEVVEPIKYHVKDWGHITGPRQMKDQIYNHGPIQCSVMVTNKFWNWQGDGIFSEQVWKMSIDHAIAIVGWGYDEKEDKEYWILRNSWGTMWGDGGFAKVQMWQDNVGVESDCAYALPADNS